MLHIQFQLVGTLRKAILLSLNPVAYADSFLEFLSR
jgi:hypothetical protein